MHDVRLIVGGNVPPRDHETLAALGVNGIFPTGTPFDTLIEFLRERSAPGNPGSK